MPKATAKANVSDSESEPEVTRSAKKSTAASKADNKERAASAESGDAGKGGDGDEDDDGSQADEQEYEIEAILDAKLGAFAEVRVVPRPSSPLGPACTRLTVSWRVDRAGRATSSSGRALTRPRTAGSTRQTQSESPVPLRETGTCLWNAC